LTDIGGLMAKKHGQLVAPIKKLHGQKKDAKWHTSIEDSVNRGQLALTKRIWPVGTP
jgi:hypothetical protein